MAEPHVISALKAKRAEISGYIQDLERHVKNQRGRLATIDAAIKLFAPGIDPQLILPKRVYRRSSGFERGELAKLCLDVLRQHAGTPITSLALADALLAEKGLSPDDGALKMGTASNAVVVLRRLRKRGIVAKTGNGASTRWALV